MSLVTPKAKHDHQLLKFPRKFLWGAATSAYQVEGNNINSDWWQWEQNQPPLLRSAKAADQYNLYDHDFNLAQQLAHNSHRLSIEWARIEPGENNFDQAEINHYKAVLKSLKNHNMKAMVTLWHFTLPQWVANQGGWENRKTIDWFCRFIERLVPELQKDVDFWITLNEPGVYVYQAYVAKEWPGKHDGIFGQYRTYMNLISAHKKAYTILHRLNPNIPVGVAQNIQSYEASHIHSIREQVSVMFSDFVANHLFHTLTKGYHDFIGVNYYFHHRYVTEKGFVPELVNVGDASRDASDLGWEIYPEGIFDVLIDLKDHLPIYITECGVASTNDDRRTRFLISYLKEVYHAITAGVDIRGFFYWSLIDNFEWHRGLDPRFGLIEVDYKTQKRTVRPSAYVYQEIIKNNGIPHKLLKLLGHTLQVEKELREIQHQA